MSAVAELPTMSKQPKPKRNDIAVKVDAEVVRMARIIAGDTNQPLAEIISEAARPALEMLLAELKGRLPDKPKKR